MCAFKPIAMASSFKREINLKLLNIETILGLREISEFLMKAYMNKFNIWKSGVLKLALKFIIIRQDQVVL